MIEYFAINCASAGEKARALQHRAIAATIPSSLSYGAAETLVLLGPAAWSCAVRGNHRFARAEGILEATAACCCTGQRAASLRAQEDSNLRPSD